MLKDLILKNRSYRRFEQDKSISRETLIELIDLARLSPSARNAQPLKYFISLDQETNDKIFPHLAWAGYLKEWNGPSKGEQPSAYIILLNDRHFINQKRIPAVSGGQIFTSEDDAEKVAKRVIEKLQNRESPTIKKEDLKDLNIQFEE